MTCFNPLHGYRSRQLTKTGKRAIVFSVKHGYIDMPITIPCGKCIGCRLDLSRQWALRCLHEAQEYEDNCYITLTYRPADLPAGGTLLREDFQLFMKRLRKKYVKYETDPDTGDSRAINPIRYYHSGEYGGTGTLRPHYHALLFNIRFNDRVLFKKINGIPLYTSKTLTRIWGKGHASVGEITMNSAAYVARYIMKKQYPSRDDDAQARYVENYERINTTTGEIHTVKPEYSTMSRNIGKEWFKKFKGDLYPKDFVTWRGEKFKPPKYYDRLYADLHPERMEKIKKTRIRNIKKQKDYNNINRLATRQRVKILQTSRLIRTLGEQP